MSVEKSLEKQQIQLLVEALRALPGIKELQVDETQKGRIWTDAKITIKPVGGKSVVLMVEAKSRSLFPRDVRDMIWTVNGDKRFQVTNPPLALLEAYSLSQGAKEMLHQNNIGYFDSGGSLFIPAPASTSWSTSRSRNPSRRKTGRCSGASARKSCTQCFSVITSGSVSRTSPRKPTWRRQPRRMPCRCSTYLTGSRHREMARRKSAA